MDVPEQSAVPLSRDELEAEVTRLRGELSDADERIAEQERRELALRHKGEKLHSRIKALDDELAAIRSDLTRIIEDGL